MTEFRFQITDFRDIVLFSYTMGVDTGEHLCYVLNFNTSGIMIFQIVVARVSAKSLRYV